MANEFKQCPNGHYYQGSSCPYCKSAGNNVNGGNSTSTETKVFGAGGDNMPTEHMPGGGSADGTKTTVVDPGFGSAPTKVSPKNPSMSSSTVFGNEDEIFGAEIEAKGPNSYAQANGGYRTNRKLVGWLVSYTLDAMGVDFKLFEGRNIIGRDMECNITVNDNMVSAKHAVILFRSGKYSITDQQSSHGTFVNGNDIELEPCYLSDGDTIRIGHTTFKFRASI